MFEMLIESSGSAKGRGGETAVSMVLHMLVLAGAVHATERAVAGGALRIADTTMIFVTHAPSPSRSAAPQAPSEPPRVPRLRGSRFCHRCIGASGAELGAGHCVNA